jgi:hypothetical protein
LKGYRSIPVLTVDLDFENAGLFAEQEQRLPSRNHAIQVAAIPACGPGRDGCNLEFAISDHKNMAGCHCCLTTHRLQQFLTGAVRCCAIASGG